METPSKATPHTTSTLLLVVASVTRSQGKGTLRLQQPQRPNSERLGVSFDRLVLISSAGAEQQRETSGNARHPCFLVVLYLVRI